jgi:hypothetical protein
LYCICFELSKGFILIVGIQSIVYKSHVTKSIVSYQIGSETSKRDDRQNLFHHRSSL